MAHSLKRKIGRNRHASAVIYDARPMHEQAYAHRYRQCTAPVIAQPWLRHAWTQRKGATGMGLDNRGTRTGEIPTPGQPQSSPPQNH